jgi:hypothetical protein
MQVEENLDFANVRIQNLLKYLEYIEQKKLERITLCAAGVGIRDWQGTTIFRRPSLDPLTAVGHHPVTTGV